MDAPVLIIGDERVTLKPMTFAAVKRLVPIFGRMSAPGSALDMRESMTDALAELLGESATEISARIIFREFAALDLQWPSIMEWIGLVPPAAGEAGATSSLQGASTS